MKNKLKIGQSVQWIWMGHAINGTVKAVYTQTVSKLIKGKSIKRCGTIKTPAYLVQSESGALALKLQTELQTYFKKTVNPLLRPTMFVRIGTPKTARNKTTK